MKVNLIVAACGKSFGIGCNGELPWRLRSEMKYFAETTSKTKDPNKRNAVIMGRKTWESIPSKFRPLKSRLNIVLSHQANYILGDERAKICASLKEGLGLLDEHPDIETCWIIGGSSVYKESMSLPQCNKIYLTHIDKEFKCDVFFPPIDDETFVEMPKFMAGVPSQIQSEGDITYSYKVFEKLS